MDGSTAPQSTNGKTSRRVRLDPFYDVDPQKERAARDALRAPSDAEIPARIRKILKSAAQVLSDPGPGGHDPKPTEIRPFGEAGRLHAGGGGSVEPARVQTLEEETSVNVGDAGTSTLKKVTVPRSTFGTSRRKDIVHVLVAEGKAPPPQSIPAPGAYDSAGRLSSTRSFNVSGNLDARPLLLDVAAVDPQAPEQLAAELVTTLHSKRVKALSSSRSHGLSGSGGRSNSDKLSESLLRLQKLRPEKSGNAKISADGAIVFNSTQGSTAESLGITAKELHAKLFLTPSPSLNTSAAPGPPSSFGASRKAGFTPTASSAQRASIQSSAAPASRRSSSDLPRGSDDMGRGDAAGKRPGGGAQPRMAQSEVPSAQRAADDGGISVSMKAPAPPSTDSNSGGSRPPAPSRDTETRQGTAAGEASGAGAVVEQGDAPRDAAGTEGFQKADAASVAPTSSGGTKPGGSESIPVGNAEESQKPTGKSTERPRRGSDVMDLPSDPDGYRSSDFSETAEDNGLDGDSYSDPGEENSNGSVDPILGKLHPSTDSPK